MAEVEGDAVFPIRDTEVEMERVSIDKVFEELLVIV